MNWNIMWHQAITGPVLKGLFIKKNQTAGFKIPVTQRGEAIRLRLVNQYGKKPYRIGGLCAVYEGALYPLTMGGERLFELPVGSAQYTDELNFPLKEGTELELRIYYKGKFDDANNIEESAVLYAGDATQSLENEPLVKNKFEETYGLYKMVPAIERVEVLSDEAQKVIVAFGDSITAMSRWTKPLAKRLSEAYGAQFTLINSGISGNCLTYEVPGFFRDSYGVMGIHRYRRDVLEIPNVETVILAFGINDIAYMTAKTEREVNEKRLIDETAKLTEILHENGIRVVCQTLAFRKGSRGFTEEMEQIRIRYNAWVRSCGLFDYVVDIEPALADPKTKDRFKSEYHQGDFLHPSMPGGEVMAECYDLEKLTGKSPEKQ